jgi:hypothetical protein
MTSIPGKELRNPISIRSRIFTLEAASMWKEDVENYQGKVLDQTGPNTKPKIVDGTRLVSGIQHST